MVAQSGTTSPTPGERLISSGLQIMTLLMKSRSGCGLRNPTTNGIWDGYYINNSVNNMIEFGWASINTALHV